MIDNRTKVDALKDLGEKITGTTIGVKENETIVGMIDKISQNYSGGGGSASGSEIILNTQLSYFNDDNNVTITDIEDIEKLDAMAKKYNENNVFPFMLITEGNNGKKYIANLQQITYYPATEYDDAELQALYICYDTGYNGTSYLVNVEIDGFIKEEEQSEWNFTITNYTAS